MKVLDKVWWYTNRLRSMSTPELRHRIEEYQIKRRERRMITVNGSASIPHNRDQQPQTRVAMTAGPALPHNLLPASLQFYALPTVTADQLPPGAVAATLATADRLLAHQITLFGHDFELGPTINWLADPQTGRSWPQSFYADLDIRNGVTVGGVKWVWELNRHHHLVTLAKAYYLSGDENYAQEVCAQLQSWIEQNPPLLGVNWTSALELALRLINWSWVLAFLGETTHLTPTLRHALAEAIHQQSAYIARHRSAHSSANNHLIGEAAGLAVTGLAFSWLPEAQRWRDEGLAILTAELPQQIYADGVPAEQATHYLAFVLDFYLFVWELARRNGHTPPAVWHTRLAAAANFLNQLMADSGFVPEIGDSDDAWVVRLDDAPAANNFRSLLVTAATILQEPTLKRPDFLWDAKSHWLLGEQGHQCFAALPITHSMPATPTFAEGGYQILRTAQKIITFDCGPLGYLATAAHGHADALSITLTAHGVPLLVDPGTYAYQEGGEWRQFLRSTAAHNTVVVDGRDQSEMQGTFLWGRKAIAKLIEWRTTPEFDLAIAEHDGYLPSGVTHRRTLLFGKPSCLFVIDELLGEGTHRFEQFWHFPAQAKVQQQERASLITVANQTMHIVPLFQREYPAQPTLYQGETTPIQGWVSAHYGHIAPAPVLGLRSEQPAPAKLVTALYLPPARPAPQKSSASIDFTVDAEKLEQQFEELQFCTYN